MGRKKGKQRLYPKENAKNQKNRTEKKVWRKQNTCDHFWKNDWARFNEQLRAYGLVLRDVGGDGNCLFRAISDHLEGNQELWDVFRRECCDYMEENSDDFAPFVPDQDFREYVRAMRRSGRWGGNLELQAISMCRKCNIVVHHLNAPRYKLTNHQDAPTIHLSYHNGEHYASVRKLGDIGGPAGPIDLGVAKAARVCAEKEQQSLLMTKNEKIVSDLSGWTDLAHIREILKMFWDDVDSAVEYLISERIANSDKYANSSSPGSETGELDGIDLDKKSDGIDPNVSDGIDTSRSNSDGTDSHISDNIDKAQTDGLTVKTPNEVEVLCSDSLEQSTSSPKEKTAIVDINSTSPMLRLPSGKPHRPPKPDSYCYCGSRKRYKRCHMKIDRAEKEKVRRKEDGNAP
eukprot:85723_1